MKTPIANSGRRMARPNTWTWDIAAEVVLPKLRPSTWTYDEISDTLHITLSSGEKVTGIELNEHLLLRVNKMERRAAGLTIFDYSILAQPTEAGMRSLPLTGLEALSNNLRDLALEPLLRPPLNAILAVSLYAPFSAQSVPIATVIVDARETV